MKTKERFEQLFELESEEPEIGKQQFVLLCQDSDVIKWWENAIGVEVTYWPYHYYKTDFPIRAIKTSEVRQWKNKKMQFQEVWRKVEMEKEAERRKRNREEAKKRKEQRKLQEEELGKNFDKLTEDDF